jgi:hypothetical protein
MGETVRKVEYFYAVVSDEPGEARKLLEFCSAHSVNLLAVTAFPIGEGRSQLDLFPDDTESLRKAAYEAGIGLVGPKRAFLIQGKERPGVLVEHHLRLADAGINVYASNGTSGGAGTFGYVVWVKPEDYEKAARALGA